MAKNYKEMAEQILDQVGGKENVRFAANCMTRLRLTLKDNALVNIDEIKKINGVLGAQFTGDQFQIIIGQDVPKVYDEVCNIGGFARQAAIEEDLDAPKQKLTVKGFFNSVLDAITGVMSPLIPVIMVAAMIRMVVAVFGPGMLNVIPADSDLNTLLTFLGDAGFYFFPVLIGYSGARKFGLSPVLGILMGGVLLHPTLINIANSGVPFKVFGIPMTAASYASSFLPMLLITWVMSYIEKFFKKIMPTALSTIFVPLCTFLVTVPLALCVLGPIGTIVGGYLASALMWVHDVLGPIGMGLIGGLWLLIVATGMHMAFAAPILTAFSTLGYDPTVVPANAVSQYASMALSLAFLIKAKDAEKRGLGASCLMSQALGGVGEPTIFGIIFRYKKAMYWSCIGSFFGALVAGILGAKGYSFGAGNFLTVLCYGPDVVKGAVACAVAFGVTLVLSLIFGIEDKTSENV